MLLKKWVYDIRFWMVVLFTIQLFSITTAPLEPAHAWRQCLTNMMARNFDQEQATLAKPMIDIAGEHSGIIASELPVLQYLIGSYYAYFGINHWIGRLINLIVSYIGIYLFYLALLNYTRNSSFSSWTALFLLISIWLSFSRKIMPDTFSVALAMMALYFLTQYFKKDNLIHLFIFGFLSAISIMSKIPAALVLVPVPLLLLSNRTTNKQKIALAIMGAISLVGPLLWYAWWVPKLVEAYKFELFFPRSITAGLTELWQFKWEGLDKLFHKGFYSYILSLTAFGGLVLAVKKRSASIITVVLLVLCIFGFYAIKTGLVFATHSYYMIPLVPFMAMSVAYLVSQKARTHKWLIVVIGLGLVESVATQWNDYFIRKDKMYMTSLEAECDVFSDRSGKVITNGTPNPQLMYFLNRKGWSLTADELQNEQYTQQILSHKPKWLIIDKNKPKSQEIIHTWNGKYPVVYHSENIWALDLTR